VLDDLTLLGRYGRSISGTVRFDRALTLGAELDGTPWSRSADSIGLALGSLRTSDAFRRDSLAVDANGDGTADFGYQAGGNERLTELYYRFKLNKAIELTPNFQWLRNPGGDGTAGTVRVFGLRARLGF
jgi:carbohydrate-selective porin OprB